METKHRERRGWHYKPGFLNGRDVAQAALEERNVTRAMLKKHGRINAAIALNRARSYHGEDFYLMRRALCTEGGVKKFMPTEFVELAAAA